jgi:hypothetical protein
MNESIELRLAKIEINELKYEIEELKQKETLHDRFAMEVLPALIGLCNKGDVINTTSICEWAYKFADAMVKAREQKTEEEKENE